MKKKYKVFAIIYFIVLGIIVFGYKDLSSAITDLSYIACGTADHIPKPVPMLTTVAYTLLIAGTPLVLITFSIITMIKAIGSGNAEDITKAKNNLFKKFITAAVIFFLASIVQFVLTRVTTNDNDKTSVTSCLKCFLYYNGRNCVASDSGNDVTENRYRKPYSNNALPPSSNSTNNNSNSTTNNSNTTTTSNAVILVGDSRTVGMCGYNDMNMHSGDSCKDFVTVAQSGKGASWFQSSAISAVNNILNNNKNKKYNIIILLGVNDVGSTSGSETNSVNIYKSKLPELAKGDWKNHTITFAYIPQVGTTIGGGMSVNQSQITNFNNQMKAFIQSQNISNLKYCDISSFDVSDKLSSDGVHLTSTGYNDYYNVVKQKCV